MRGLAEAAVAAWIYAQHEILTTTVVVFSG